MAGTNYHTANGRKRAESTNGVRATYGTDALGSVTGTYDQNGNAQNTYLWAPYGTLIQKTGTAADPKFGWNGASGYRDTGRSYSGFYVRARHYDFLTGQWTCVDSLLPSQPAYNYCLGGPVNIVDPSGKIAAYKACSPLLPNLSEGVEEAAVCATKKCAIYVGEPELLADCVNDCVKDAGTQAVVFALIDYIACYYSSDYTGNTDPQCKHKNACGPGSTADCNQCCNLQMLQCLGKCAYKGVLRECYITCTGDDNHGVNCCYTICAGTNYGKDCEWKKW